MAQMDELRAAVGRLNVNKAVVTDGVPGTVFKWIFEHRAHDLPDRVNSIYETGRVPVKWNVARLILLKKSGKDPRLASSYRPISILPAMSKVWEYTFKSAIEKKPGMDPFHRNQFVFRKGKSTIDAIMQVCNFADSCRMKGIVCAMICIDVKNAFNSLRWEIILKGAKLRKLPYNLTRVLANYLKDRFVVLDNLSGLIVKQIFAGVPQCPYNVMSALKIHNSQQTLTGEVLNTREMVKYLGIVLDSNRNYFDHFDAVSNRADEIVGAIRGLLPNVNGPSDACRKLYRQGKECSDKYLSGLQDSFACRVVRVDRDYAHSYQGSVSGKNLREETVDEWRREWTRSNTNNWTRRLIEDAAIFRKRKRSIDHYTMQLLIGHGIFNTYRVRMNKETADKCSDCDACPDDAEHALLRSPSWADQCTTLENVVSDTFTINNIIVLVSADDHT
ncbi:uncharacterized protein LOC117214898 [Bombus bifarius]|uniref:Uncharacterized protein LOC117214898 n=1 Tax=Bombus bifarius TaxID=103933 RepID=A0A6P8MTK7_9HYME|nr:uncharacterized protein LOC117214898 [Bombus bifarius]